jgi:putative oxidoreductase
MARQPSGRSSSALARVVVVWILSILTAVLLVAAGLPKILGQGGWTARFDRWGYPARFVVVIGVVEVVAALMLLIPRVAALGAAILAVVMLGAAGTHLVHGETPRIAVTLVLFAVFVAIAWLRRPTR